ncbi:hypothetical protein ACW0JT_18895 [Arthrobacter sp. SA17]
MEDFDLAYLKLDYNIDIGAGTDLNGAIGAGLLDHNRAFLAWVTSVMDRHPGLTIEGCAAGGSRLDSASGAVFPIQSLTDQQDFAKMPPISAAAPSQSRRNSPAFGRPWKGLWAMSSWHSPDQCASFPGAPGWPDRYP